MWCMQWCQDLLWLGFVVQLMVFKLLPFLVKELLSRGKKWCDWEKMNTMVLMCLELFLTSMSQLDSACFWGVKRSLCFNSHPVDKSQTELEKRLGHLLETLHDSWPWWGFCRPAGWSRFSNFFNISAVFTSSASETFVFWLKLGVFIFPRWKY